ncbi:hypothetical protein GTP23_11305 [Pseudoduganella sp. FT93W]|uniref:Uncharacterized protein n=1 Tax=Duganella fentianensis TaxID=2692177 RepID=A0A845I1I4_9BURK|nr:hypothetical protein [Duganella fentianensis]MYN45635.1 hypothetical protein [Duganella fentianensis]
MTCHAEHCYDGPMLSITTNREGNRVHRLIDDTLFPTRPKKVLVRRDPMVAALFGAAPGASANDEAPALAAAGRARGRRPATGR